MLPDSLSLSRLRSSNNSIRHPQLHRHSIKGMARRGTDSSQVMADRLCLQLVGIRRQDLDNPLVTKALSRLLETVKDLQRSALLIRRKYKAALTGTIFPFKINGLRKQSEANGYKNITQAYGLSPVRLRSGRACKR
ncbi:MAG: hypothetical protein WC364_12875 [Eubacteriales bacterium]